MHNTMVFEQYWCHYISHQLFLITYLPVITAFQFTAATRNGLIGLTVASPVGEENNTVIVSAQILGQYTEDVTVAALDHEQNCGHVTFGGVQVQTKSDYRVIICIKY